MTTGSSIQSDNAKAELESALVESSKKIKLIMDSVGQIVLGQENLRKRLITALVTDGHLLLEGVPGLAKTLAIKTFSEAVEADFSRIQFTPDLLPADLLGTEIFRPDKGDFVVRKGPVFANFVLADEINRAPAKVQSALLEIMQERQVTIAGETFPLPEPFLVLATQNPVEQEGTYPLPEAQVDRFIMKVKIDYPTTEDEFRMLETVTKKAGGSKTRAEVAASLQDVALLKDTCSKIYIDERIRRYIVDLVNATRKPSEYNIDVSNFIELGASPRASIALYECARAEALLEGETFVRPEFVKKVAPDVLRHRLALSYEAEAEGLDSDQIVKTILDGVQVP